MIVKTDCKPDGLFTALVLVHAAEHLVVERAQVLLDGLLGDHLGSLGHSQHGDVVKHPAEGGQQDVLQVGVRSVTGGFSELFI